jgi:DNA-binding winged helix-turn-helix (wHTH) protein
METNWVISFGPFRVTRARRVVERNGDIVRLGSRAFDVLVYLLEHTGQVVSHRALLEAAWPGTYVEEGSLRFQMAVLRKALGNGDASYIINVPGRGYCFTAPLSKEVEVQQFPSLPASEATQLASSETLPVNGVRRAANILPYPMSQLFAERAREIKSAIPPDWEEDRVTDICTKLDNLVSAIELVAAQVKALGTDKLSEVLEERWLASWPDRRAVSRRRGSATSRAAESSRAPGDIRGN